MTVPDSPCGHLPSPRPAHVPLVSPMLLSLRGAYGGRERAIGGAQAYTPDTAPQHPPCAPREAVRLEHSPSAEPLSRKEPPVDLDRTPAQIANTAAEEIRALNHRTLGLNTKAYDNAPEVSGVVTALATLVERIPQALQQAEEGLRAAAGRGQAVVPYGWPLAGRRGRRGVGAHWIRAVSPRGRGQRPPRFRVMLGVLPATWGVSEKRPQDPVPLR